MIVFLIGDSTSSRYFFFNTTCTTLLTYAFKDDALSPKLFHPSDLTSLPRSAQSPITNVNGSTRRKAPVQKEDPSMRRTRSSVEIQRYAEDEDDEDFSDIFGKDDAVVEKDESDRGSEDGVGALMLHSKLSNNSWLGDEDDEDDPFASLEQGFDEMDLQANIARDKHARLCTLIEGLVSSLKVTEDPDTLSDLSEQLVSPNYTHSPYTNQSNCRSLMFYTSPRMLRA
jgi:hypothetical protein